MKALTNQCGWMSWRVMVRRALWVPCMAPVCSQLKSRSSGGDISEQVRDNSIKVLVSEKGRWQEVQQQKEEERCSAERNRSNSVTFKENIHQHFFFSHSPDQIGFSTTWLEFEHILIERLRTCWVWRTGSMGHRKYTRRAGEQLRPQ